MRLSMTVKDKEFRFNSNTAVIITHLKSKVVEKISFAKAITILSADPDIDIENLKAALIYNKKEAVKSISKTYKIKEDR